MELDERRRRLTVRIVYLGPSLSGKTTNLERLRGLLRPELSGEFLTLETRNDRTLFFDLWPTGFRAPSGLLVKFKLFTAPGHAAHEGTRRALLAPADGVVFVADSQRSQAVSNYSSFSVLADSAAGIGRDFAQLPLVVQYNKRDLPDIVDADEVRERWRASGRPLVFASALRGEGVRETLAALLAETYGTLDSAVALGREHRLTSEAFVRAALGAGDPGTPTATGS